MIFKQILKLAFFRKKLFTFPQMREFGQFNNKIINKIKTNDRVQVQKAKSLNSLSPSKEEGFAYGHHFPKNWSQQFIYKVLDPSSQNIDRISIVKTKVGQNSGKIIIKFKNQKIREKYIQKYNEDFIITQNQSHRIVILPFVLKTQQKLKKLKEGLNFKNPVKISNLDFDITKQQLHKLTADYGQVSHIQMSVRQSGINRGFAIFYFQARKAAQQFVNFIDNFKYKERKLKAYIVEKQQKKQDIQLLKAPTYTFKANQELMRRMSAKIYQQKN